MNNQEILVYLNIIKSELEEIIKEGSFERYHICIDSKVENSVFIQFRDLYSFYVPQGIEFFYLDEFVYNKARLDDEAYNETKLAHTKFVISSIEQEISKL